ncbi:MAG TPA: energy transducer TonB [Gammaproteobacteria bacterium]
MLRYAGSFVIGLFMVMGVLVAMQSLVVGRQFQLSARAGGDTTSVVNLNTQTSRNLQLNVLPDKPGTNRTPPLPEDTSLARVQPPDLPLPSMALPAFKPPFATLPAQAIAEAAPEQAAPAASTAPARQPVLAVGDIVLMERVEPKFPPQAIRAGIESGSVTVKFTVEPDGSVSNAVVTDAKPRRGVFDDAALRAVVKWKFKPLAQPRDTSVIVAFSQGGGG